MLYPYIEEGGLVWMLPLVFLSFLAFTFCLERSWYWFIQTWHSQGRQKKLRHFFLSPLENRNILEHSHDPVLVTLRKFLEYYENLALAIAESQTKIFAEDLSQQSRRSLDVTCLIANLSSALGLFGTVVGISMTFKSLGAQDAKGISLSLATALYTTVAGLMLFFLTYIGLFFFQKLSSNLETSLENAIQTLKDSLETYEKSKMIFEKTGATGKTPKKNPPQSVSDSISSSSQENCKQQDSSSPISSNPFYDDDEDEVIMPSSEVSSIKSENKSADSIQ